MNKDQLKDVIFKIIDENYPINNDSHDNVPYAAKVYDTQEIKAGIGSIIDFWLTLGCEGDRFERELSQYLGVKDCLLTNSGSSANLLAISSLTSYKLGSRRLEPGDEVITAAVGFPTTVAPILQNRLLPVYVDCDPATLNIDVSLLEEALSNKTKAVVLAHTLGNPFDLGVITKFCEDNDLWLIEDNCDALGSLYNTKLTGSFGHISTQSFYPPHHITMGEGGAVNINHNIFKRIVESFRDWGRDCWCKCGVDDTCHMRYGWSFDGLPEGYDHKYIYTHLGYNLKPTDIQAAIGRVQLSKLSNFIISRKSNWSKLRSLLNPLNKYIDFQLPTHAIKWVDGIFEWDNSGNTCDPSWFGFMIMVKPECPVSRQQIITHLNNHKIATRMMFGGNITRQPAFRSQPHRTIGSLLNADIIMNNTFFVGVYPGLTDRQIEYTANRILELF